MNLFPYPTVRPQQDKLITAVRETVQRNGKLVVHAPTGLGKTAAALAPAIEHALEKNKTVLFLTSRLTQHALALQTVKQISERHGIPVPVIDLIGKKHMCLQQGAASLKGKEFAEYCKNMREDGVCEYYENLKRGEQLSPATKSVLVHIGAKAITPENVKICCAEQKLCPYEVTMLLAKDARVIITDYSYLFNEKIRDGFFHRINRTFADCILIVDEGHNLPDRVKDLSTERITITTIKRSVRELEKYKQEDHIHHVRQIGELLTQLCEGAQEERYLRKDELLEGIARICPIRELSNDLDKIAALVREDQKVSSAGALADFLEAWQGEDEGFTRILRVNRGNQATLFGQRQENFWQLSYRCLDPSVITKPVFDQVASTITMSGTLTPTQMYGELLGLSDAANLMLPSPFPDENRLNVIIPKTTTKFKSRSPAMYAQITEICTALLDIVPGNVAIFFPSYALLQEVKERLDTKTSKTILAEHHTLTKEEREALLQRFRDFQGRGAVLLGVMGGSFSEGIDLPGDELRTVIIVGLPLGRPDLETKALIDYYQEKFGKGWEYGYTFPAFNRTLQSAGRCIRSSTDKGAIIFLDERYAWENYYKCFPSDWSIRVTLLYENLIRDFFR